ncbi:Ldh family oxidoreductase [Candidatus Bathyarchaeota archaeon]|nr:Ldh family oxidoreductase [Candidatus Bathyarchaeota archaeon]
MTQSTVAFHRHFGLLADSSSGHKKSIKLAPPLDWKSFMITSKIQVDDLESLMVKMLRKVDVTPANARDIAWVFKTMTLRGVGHHDIGSFPGIIRNLRDGVFNPRPKIKTVVSKQATAVMDADNAPGTLAAFRMTEKAILKARKYGIGIVTMRNSNHFLGSAAYNLLAAEQDMIGITMSNTLASMAAHGSKDKAIGNNPWGFAAKTGAEFPIMLDIANAYASFGKLFDYMNNNWDIPREWGLDELGENTSDPSRVLRGGVSLPMAGHKGFGLAIMVELLTSILAGGAITENVRMNSLEGNGHSQASIVININHFLPVATFEDRTKEMVELLHNHEPLDSEKPVLLPGERSYTSRKKLADEGIVLNQKTVDELTQLLDELNIRT